MYKGKKVLCVIPARSGSKGIPGKNIKLLCGRPLIAYSIEQALATEFIDRTLVSTDDEKKHILVLFCLRMHFVETVIFDKIGNSSVSDNVLCGTGPNIDSLAIGNNLLQHIIRDMHNVMHLRHAAFHFQV